MNVLYIVLLCAAFAVIEGLIGGTRLLFSLPSYLILALAAVFSLADLRRVKVTPSSFCLVASALFFGYILWRGMTSPVAYLAWADEFMVMGALVVYLITACYLTDPRRRLWVLAVLVGLGFVNVVVGARQFVSGSNWMLFGFLRSERYAGRASGLYICPDHLAFFLEVVGCLALAAAIWGRSRVWVKLVLGYSALCLFGGLLLTASRGGFLSASAGLAVMVVLGLWRLWSTAPHLLLRACLVVAILVALAAGGLRLAVNRHPLLHDRAVTLLSTRDIRPRLWQAGYEQYRMSPVLGTGAATYLYYGRRLRYPYVQDDPIRTHNDYLEMLGEYGAVVVPDCCCSWRRISGPAGAPSGIITGTRRGTTRLAAIFPAATRLPGTSEAWRLCAAMGAHSVVDFNLHIPANTLLAAFVFGVLANPGRRLAPGSEPMPGLRSRDLLPRLSLAALGLVILALGGPKLPGEYYCEKARAALRDGHALAAAGFASKGVLREQRNPQLYFYLGEARLSLAGDGPDSPVAHSFRAGADDAYVRGLALAPWDTPLLLRHAQILTIFGDLPAAGRVFDTALVWDPNSALVQTYYGFYLQRAGRVAEARQAYGRALQLAPNAAAASGFDRVSKMGLGTN